MKKILPFLLVAFIVAAGELTLEEALRRAEEYSPVLRGAKEEQKSVDEIRTFYLQGSAPELEIGTENLGIGEIELLVSKEIRQMAKKKPIEVELELRKKSATIENRPALLELHQKVAENYIKLAFLNESQLRLESIVLSLEEEKREIKRRVRLGAASEMELLEHEGLIIGMDEILLSLKGDIRLAQSELNGLWEDELKSEVHTLAELKSLLVPIVESGISSKHPALQHLEFKKSEAALLRAQSKGSSKPDIAISSGYKRSNESGENAFLLGVSIGFNSKSEARIKMAEAALTDTKVAIEKEAVERELQKGILSYVEQKNKKESLLLSLKNKRIPLAESLIDAAQKRYKRGALSAYEMIRYRRELYLLQLEELEIEKELLLIQLSQIIYSGTLLN